MILVSTQLVTKMSTSNLPGVKGRPAREADNLAALCEHFLENVGASTFHKRMGLHGLLMGEIDLILYDMYIYFFVHG
jgi:hypothetical protein